MRTTTCLIALFLFIPAAAPAQEIGQRIEAYVAQYHEFGLFNGSVLIADRGNVVFEKGYGEADFSWEVPNTPATRFRLGSLTKQFTAVLILQLMEEGEIDLAAPLTRYLPDYPAEPGDRISIEHLLRHTSGIPEYWPLTAFHEDARRGAGPKELTRHFSTLPLDFEPGSNFAYSNSGYFLLGLIIEAVTGIPYEDNLRQRILEPLGLAETGYENGGEVIERMASGYQRIAGEVRPAPFMPPAGGFSAAMMYASLGDMLRWSRALHAAEPFQHPATLGRMLTPGLGDYGLGLEVRERDLGGRRLLVTSHEGGINGFGTMFHYLPETGTMVIAADNTQRSMIAMTEGLLRMVHGEPPPPPRRPISDVLRETIRTAGLDAARIQYLALSESDSASYDLREFQLNRLGYEFLVDGRLEEAIGLFRLNTEAYPEAFNTWDSLGEALLAAGQQEEAVRSYRRSLELNPENENARQVLLRLGSEP